MSLVANQLAARAIRIEIQHAMWWGERPRSTIAATLSYAPSMGRKREKVSFCGDTVTESVRALLVWLEHGGESTMLYGQPARLEEEG